MVLAAAACSTSERPVQKPGPAAPTTAPVSHGAAKTTCEVFALAVDDFTKCEKAKPSKRARFGALRDEARSREAKSKMSADERVQLEIDCYNRLNQHMHESKQASCVLSDELLAASKGLKTPKPGITPRLRADFAEQDERLDQEDVALLQGWLRRVNELKPTGIEPEWLTGKADNACSSDSLLFSKFTGTYGADPGEFTAEAGCVQEVPCHDTPASMCVGYDHWVIEFMGIEEVRITWLDSGVPSREQVWFDDELHLEGQYRNGKKHGQWKTYKPDGALDKFETYKDGAKVE